MLALNYKTGEFKWGFQQVHHDVWDYDSSNQPTMINVEVPGKGRVEGMVQANKDGYVSFVNADNGQPVFPIEEKPVPVKAGNKNFPTQPIPVMPPFYPQKLTEKEYTETQESVNGALAAKNKELEEQHKPTITGPLEVVKNSGYKGEDVFSAWSEKSELEKGEDKVEVSSDALSGDNEAPSSYDPTTGDYYVCSRKGLYYVYITEKAKPVYTEGGFYEGEPFLTAAHIGEPGWLTAYNMKTGAIAWQKEWPHECYSGILTTAGGVLFTGQINGELTAYNAETGALLSEFQMGAGVGGPMSAYEFGGKERIGVYAGGNLFDFAAKEHVPGNIHGDLLWQLSLSGTLPQVEVEYWKTHHEGVPAVPKETTDY
jgi:hypothetical protein